MRRILWLATADTSGRLLRAHVMAKRLAECGIPVDVVTTSRAGVEFLKKIGTSATLLEGDYRIEFDERQNLDVSGTARRILKYVSDPNQFLGDFNWLRSVEDEALCVVNDFHPAVVVGDFFQAGEVPVVHVHGDFRWRAMGRPFASRVGSLVNPVYERLLRRLRHSGTARVVHRPLAAFDDNWTASDQVELPPLVPGPEAADEAVRGSSGADRPTVAVYLNPHFRDPDVARSVEKMIGALEADVHAVSDVFAHRAGWKPSSVEWIGRVEEADLLVGAPEMAAIGFSRAYRTPLLMMLTDQPAQRRNAKAYRNASGVPPSGVVEVDTPDFSEPLVDRAEALLEDGRADDGPTYVDQLQAAWADAFATLVRRIESPSAGAAA